MKKSLVLAAVILLMVGVNVAFAHHGPATVTIKAAAAKQAPVVFPHAKHSDTLVKTCDTCHHTNKGLTKKTDTKVQKCYACHLDPKDKAPSMREASLQKNPVHKLCITCHKAQKKGPTTCTVCHTKTT